MRTSLSILTTVLALASQAAAYNSFVGCVAYESIPKEGSIYLAGSAANDGATCASACTNDRRAATYGYSIWDENSLQCSCTTLGGRDGGADISAPAAFRFSVDAAGTCDPLDLNVWRLGSAWQNDASLICASTFAVGSPNTRQTSVATLNQCFTSCQSYPSMVVRPITNTGQFSCLCATTISTEDEDAANCGPDISFIYARTAAAAASGVYRRSIREAAKREKALKQAKFPYCPDHSQACKITGSVDGYECIETKYELESCGGCTEGVFGATGNSTMSGTDCTQLSGVPMGAISCLDGKCIAYACEAGWKLKKGVCTKV